MNKDLICKATSKGNKFNLNLIKDSSLIQGKNSYSVVDITNGSLRSSMDAGSDIKTAKIVFKQKVKDWNDFNKVSKLKIVGKC